MNKTQVVNVDLVDVPHIRVEVESEQALEDAYEDWRSRTHKNWMSDFYEMNNRFESCFIVYRESMPDIMFYAQE